MSERRSGGRSGTDPKRGRKETERPSGPAMSGILRGLDEAFDHPTWHGPNLLSSLRGVGPEEAAWRPGAGRHCIQEIVLHCAYWKHRVRARVATSREASSDRFPRKGRNWFPAPTPLTTRGWREGVALLKRTHAALRDAAAALDDPSLERAGPGQKRLRRQHLEGIAFHDVYHAGQIRLLRKLYEEARGS